MTEPTEAVVVEDPTTTRRFDVRKALKVTAVTAAAVGLVVIAKRKLTGNVDGEVNLNVSTDDQS